MMRDRLKPLASCGKSVFAVNCTRPETIDAAEARPLAEQSRRRRESQRMTCSRSIRLRRREMLFALGALAGSTPISGFAGMVLASAGGTAHLILKNGRIWTGDRHKPQAATLAVAGNKILAVG